MVIPTDQAFHTNAFFSGGAGCFVEYHDIVKPVYLYAVIKMILNNESYGMPTYLIKDMSLLSILEWYQNRRYRNPLQQLDWAHSIPEEKLDNLLGHILNDDSSIYDLAPVLNIGRLLDVYRSQHMCFPWFIYSKHYEDGITTTLGKVFQGTDYKYLHGDLKSAIMRCDQNFTYIFSDIETAKKASEILIGTCSHILVARDYRYNFTDDFKTMKYDLGEIARTHPFLRIETTTAMDIGLMEHAFDNVLNVTPETE